VGLDLRGARVAVQGFGSVGRHSARFLAERGAVLVGASDSAGAVVDPSGLDIEALVATKRSGHVTDHPTGQQVPRDDLVAVDCDIWIPAARPHAIRAGNADRVTARIIAQGANLGVSPEAEQVLHARGILSLPDFIGNAGGVICGSVEYHGGSRAQAFAKIDERIRANVAEVLDRASTAGVTPARAARDMAAARVRRAMQTRRWT